MSGSIRTVAKGTTNPGGVYGFFFSNDNVFEEYESDIELLTRHPSNVSLTNQYHTAEGEQSGVMSQTNITLSNGGSITDWHEYRMGWVPGSVSFYVNGVLKLEKTKHVPVGLGAWVWAGWR